MKKLTLIAAVAIMTFLFSGCMQMHMDSTIEKDGSGSMSMTMSLSKVLTESLDDLKTMDMGEDMGGMDMMMEMDKDELQKQVKEYGVKVKTFEKSLVDGRQTVNVSMEFKDLEGLSYAMHALTQDDGGGLGFTDNGDGTFTLEPHEYAWPAVEEEAEEEEEAQGMPEMDPEAMGKQMEVMGKLMSSISELDISMKITVPGDIVESNAPTVEGRTSIWTINGSNMMTAGSNMEPHITFQGKGLKLKATK
jgi:hypothetical protein